MDVHKRQVFVRFILFLSLLAVLPGCAAQLHGGVTGTPRDCLIAYEEAVVSRHVDGDTVYVKDMAGNQFVVRFIGIDCPESTIEKDPYGKEASDYTESALLGRTVYLEKDVSETDRYGRLLRYVWIALPDAVNDDEIRTKMFNAVLVAEGYAKVSTYVPDVKYQEVFVRFQKEAVESNAGLWGAQPITDNDAAVMYIGNSNTMKYHLPECRWVKEIKQKNIVIFTSRAEAEKAGYSPCKVCSP